MPPEIVEVARGVPDLLRALSARELAARAAEARQAWSEPGAVPDSGSRLASAIHDVSGEN